MSSLAQPPQVERDPLALTICPECGYSLESLPSEGVCPECGEHYDQTYVVLFGETPEGTARRASWILLLMPVAAAAFVVFIAIRMGGLLSRSVLIVLGYLGLHVLLWTTRRASVRKEIIFQVWLNDRGFTVRRPKSETTWLAYVERILPYLWPIFFVPTFIDGQPVGVAYVVFMLIWLAFVVVILILVQGPPRRRRIHTGDPRQPTLTSWSRDDVALVESTGSGAARLRITSCSYVGWWKWSEWKVVDAVVRLGPEQVTVLRQRMDRWISAHLRRP